jgi:hypothetical protein
VAVDASVDAMLARLTELDDRPLTKPRPPKERLIGCCRRLYPGEQLLRVPGTVTSYDPLGGEPRKVALIT